jgi:hypothetical protein
LSNPVAKQVKIRTVRIKPPAAPVWHLTGRFQQDQARIWLKAIDPPALHVSGQGLKVETGIVAPETESEPVLAAGCSMTRSGITALTGEDWHDIVHETCVLGFFWVGRRIWRISGQCLTGREHPDHPNPETDWEVEPNIPEAAGLEHAKHPLILI